MKAFVLNIVTCKKALTCVMLIDNCQIKDTFIPLSIVSCHLSRPHELPKTHPVDYSYC